MRAARTLTISAPFLSVLFVGPSLVAQELSSASDRTPPADWLRSCAVETGGNSREAAWCGKYRVYEDREARRGREIDLNVVVLPARSPNPDPDPVFYFMGGPGGAATEGVRGASQVLSQARATKDLVLMDQRGTGSSHPLDCPDVAGDAPLQEYFAEFLELDYVRRCLEMQDADVALYTTPIAMDDYDEVRKALGYERINLYGGSYGTRAALIYMRRHGEHVRSAVLKGVAPTDMKNPLPFARAAERGLRAVFDACAAEPECQAAFPDLEGDWEKALARFDAAAVTAKVVHPETRDEETVTIARGVFADGVRHILYSMQEARDLPRIIHHAGRGDFSVFAQRELRQAVGFENLLSAGMFLTVTCSEDLRFISEEEIGPATSGTFLGDYRVRRQLAACEVWGRGDVGRSYTDPVGVDVPALLISGIYDTATPYEGAEEVARHLPNSLHIIFPNQSHGFANFSCETRLINEFIDAGAAEGLDTSCVAETRRPKFVVGSRSVVP